MKRQAILSLVALALAVLAPLTAKEATGLMITGLDVAPSPATAGSPVIITVNGTIRGSECRSVDLDYGDGTPHATLVGSFPLIQKHTYQKAGTFTLKAGNNCSLQALATLTVKSPMGQMGNPNLTSLSAAMADFLKCPGPRIDDGPNSQISPGSQVAVYGCGFGATPGRLILVLMGPGDQQLENNWTLTDLQWHDDKVLGTVSPVKWMKDQTARLKVVTSKNVESNAWSVPFMATRDVLSLPISAMQVIHCDGGLGSSNKCNTVQADSFNGLHDTWWLGGDGGTDSFSATLKNGWVFTGITFNFGFHSVLFNDFSSKGAAHLPAGGPKVGSTSTTMAVKWSTQFAGHVVYYGGLFIVGPSGIPFQ